jgi:TrmH family RNA methyltransferase
LLEAARQLSSYADLIEINKEVYQKLATGHYRRCFGCGQNQIDAVIRFKIIQNPLILIAEARKPGNIGALLRTAALLIWMQFYSKSKSDLYNPHSAIQRWMFVYQPNCNWNYL